MRKDKIPKYKFKQESENLYTENCKTLQKQIKDIHKDILCTRLGRQYS